MPIVLVGMYCFSCSTLCNLMSAIHEPRLVDSSKEDKAEMYRLRQLGDKAFKDGFYHLALKFYMNYHSIAENLDDVPAIIDASECLISTYVNSGNAVAAETIFKKTFDKYSDMISEDKQLRNRFYYWEGNIQLALESFENAIGLFAHLLENLPQNSKLFFQTLDAKGTAEARAKKWLEAEKTYAVLEFAASSSSQWKQLALKKRILALLMSEDFSRAEQLIKKVNPENSTYSAITEILLSVRKKKLTRAFEQYNSIRKYAHGSDILWFLMAKTLSNAFLDGKKYEKALFVLNDAIIYASSEYDRQTILLKIINTAVVAGKIDAAVTTAEKFLKNYPDSFISNEIRLRLANLYSGEKKSDDALQVYETVLNDPNADFNQKIQSARSAARIFIALKNYKSARDKFEFIADEGEDSKTRGEGKFWLAELLYLQGEFRKAAEGFKEVADGYVDWREQSLFRRIKSLFFAKDFEQISLEADRFLREFSGSEYIPEVMFLHAFSLQKRKRYSESQKRYKDFVSAYPDNEYSPRAMFEIATIELEHNKTEDAVIAYTDMIKKYPKSNLVPNALYRRMNACFWCGFSRKAANDAESLLNLYPYSEFTEFAGYALADYHLRGKRYKEAVDVYKKLIAIHEKEREKHAALLYEIADIRFKQGESAMALNVLDELSEKFSDTSMAGDCLLLRGDVLVGKSEYERAVPFFVKASNFKKGSQLEISALGRLGDVYLALGSKTPDGTNYLKAVSYYSKVLQHLNLTARFRDQALYKLGRCEELLGDKGKAISRYHEAIYNYELDAEKGRKDATASIWFIKSALAAARLYQEKGRPESAEAAIAIYKTLIKAGVAPIDDFKRKIMEISTKYQLKE